jgi:hypothetical protein
LLGKNNGSVLIRNIFFSGEEELSISQFILSIRLRVFSMNGCDRFVMGCN